MTTNQTNSTNNTPHHMQQHGKGFEIINRPPTTVKVNIGDEEREVSCFKIVATWIKPKDPKKPTYVYTVDMILNAFEQKGIFPKTSLSAIKMKVEMIYRECRKLVVYDNRPDNPYQILAWYQDGKWLPVEHPDAKRNQK